MIIYPAIDLKYGKCVRLHKGVMDSETVYNDNPAEQAHQWAQNGFSWIHIVDLNGAIEGKPVNEQAVKDIIEIINNTTEEFKMIPSIDRMIAHRYDQKLEDVQEWMSITEWSQENLDRKTVAKIQDRLLELDIIPRKVNYEELVYTL